MQNAGQPDEISEPKSPAPRRSRRRRVGLWILACLTIAVLSVAVAFYSAIGRQVSAPDWLRQDITERLNSKMTGVQLSFGDVGFVLETDWVPRLVLRNVRVTDQNGERLAVLSDLDSTVALKPLMNGKIQPGTVRLSGATLRLRRSAEGRVGVAVGENPTTIEEASSFAALANQIDRLFLLPDLIALSRVEMGNLTLQYEDARAGKAWTVDGGRLLLTRAGKKIEMRGDFVLLGNRGYATTLEMNYAGEIGDAAASFGMSFDDMPARDIAGQSPALAWLETLDAPISGALRASVDEEGGLGPLNATLRIGAGVLQPIEATKPIPFTQARSYFTYDPIKQTMQIDELFLNSKWVTARAEGKAFLVGMEQGWPRELWSQIRITEFRGNPADFYPEPIEIEGAQMDMRLELDPFKLTLGEISFSDQGQRLVLRGEVEARPDGWFLALDGQMDGISPARLMQLWPEGVTAKARDWIRDNVVDADLSNIQLAVRALPKHRPDVYLGFAFDRLETTFMNHLPPIKAGAGRGSLYRDRFVVNADEGYITAPQGGRVDVSGTSFVIPSVRVKRAPARVILNTQSTITAALSLLDEKPFGFLTKAGQPVTLADGQATASGQLDFLLKPQLQPDEVAFEVKAVARSVRTETLVPGRVLAASELDVVARNGLLEISGEGRIGRVPVKGIWNTDISPNSDGSSQLVGTVELSERFIDEFRIGLPPGSVSGAGQGAITIDFPKGKAARFSLKSSLAGVGLRLRPLSWSLSQAGKGVLEVSGRLGTPPEIDRLALDAPGLSAAGSVRLKPNGQLDRASFSRVRAGTWLNAPVDLVGRGAANPAVKVKGGTLDMRQTSLGSDGGASSGGGGAGAGGPVSLLLDRLQISDGIALTDFKAELNMAKGADGPFSGRVNGGAAITGQVVPQGKRSAFRVRSKNAGGVFSSAGLLKTAREGEMDLILVPATAKGSYNGKLTVQNIRLKDAPALAALLNALSVVGILEQLDGEGIHFGEVDAEFQLTPRRVIVTRGSAVGASLGISMDGYYFMESGQMDMQGVFSPFYLVNAIGGIFTRRGEGLIGFNYELKGPASSPRVSVNPLSILTPGMFREIFRRPVPEIQR